MRTAAPFLASIVTLLACSGSASKSPATRDGGALDSKPGEAGDAGDTGAPDVPGMRIIGRWQDDPGGPRIGWPATRVVVRFTGTGAFVKLVDTDVDGGPSRYDVVVDGQTSDVVVVVAEAARDHTLATKLAPGEHTIELVRRTEGRLGTTQVISVAIEGGSLLPPPAPAPRRIEFLGDSESNGYGIEGNGPSCTFSAETQNVRKAYPSLVAEALSAEPVVLGYSGKGLLRNADGSTGEVFGELYLRAVPTDPTSRWATAQPSADVVVIALGGNDWERPNPDVFDPPSEAALETRYRALVDAVRASHSDARIFCAHPASLTDGHPEGYDAYTKMKAILESVVSARAANGDKRVHYFEFPRAGDEDRTGCDYHYGPAFHRTMADALATAIRAETGW